MKQKRYKKAQIFKYEKEYNDLVLSEASGNLTEKELKRLDYLQEERDLFYDEQNAEEYI